MELKTIAHIYTDFDEKFGIPRQSGLVPSLQGRIVFEKEFRDPDCVRELDGYDYIWLLWHFSELPEDREYTPMVRPPRLGGNHKVGVFASRSPFRPNPLGLSCLKLERIEPETECGPVIYVSGVDMLNATPVFDIKPYLPGTESHPLARGGYAGRHSGHCLEVADPDGQIKKVPESLREALAGVLSQDPRPGYQNDSSRVYGISFAGYNIRFTVDGDTLTVVGAEPV